jgi:hypothetical protein
VNARLTSRFLADDGTDVDGLFAFSISMQNRRKARAGLALENHLEALCESARHLTLDRLRRLTPPECP